MPPYNMQRKESKRVKGRKAREGEEDGGKGIKLQERGQNDMKQHERSFLATPSSNILIEFLNFSS